MQRPAMPCARSRAQTEREIEVCAQCHARRGQIAEGYQAGKPFLDYYRPAFLTAPLYHTDGQQRGEVYNWGSFLQSKMYANGVTCSDCHNPHSGKLRAEGNVSAPPVTRQASTTPRRTITTSPLVPAPRAWPVTCRPPLTWSSIRATITACACPGRICR